MHLTHSIGPPRHNGDLIEKELEGLKNDRRSLNRREDGRKAMQIKIILASWLVFRKIYKNWARGEGEIGSHYGMLRPCRDGMIS
jgi:hypothetical protein